MDERKREEEFLPLDALPMAQILKLFCFQRGQTILLLSKRVRESDQWHRCLYRAGAIDRALDIRGNSHGSTNERPKLIQRTPSIPF